MPPFEFATASRILFGPGTLNQVGTLAQSWGPTTLVVTGANTRRAEPLLSLLNTAGVSHSVLSVPGEPSIPEIEQALLALHPTPPHSIIGFGGGSAIDTAKALAILLTQPGTLSDYLEVVGNAQPLPNPGLPCLAIPTTAGTGSEVTRNSVLTSPVHHVKVSLRSPRMLPTAAIIDPTLTLNLPRSLTLTTGLDALSQLVEPYTCNRSNPITDPLCLQGIQAITQHFNTTLDSPQNLPAREAMCLASLLGGLALANAGLGAVHGLAGPIGGLFPAAHGAICGALLPHVVSANIQTLLNQPDSPASSATLERYTALARLLTGNTNAIHHDAATHLTDWTRQLGAPTLRDLHLRPDAFPEIIRRAKIASSMKANPVTLSDATLLQVLENAWSHE